MVEFRKIDIAFNKEKVKIVSEHDQKIPQSQTADKPMAQRGRAIQQSRDTRKDKLSKAASSLPVGHHLNKFC